MSRIDVAPAPHLHVVLVEPEIAANTGSVGRTCVAIGAMLWLVRPLGFHVNDKNIRRAGLDYWEHLDWRVVDHLDEVASELGHDRLWLFSTKANQPYTNVSLSVGRCAGFRTREPRPSNLVADRAPGPRRADPDPSRGPQPEPVQRGRGRRLRSDAPDRTIELFVERNSFRFSPTEFVPRSNGTEWTKGDSSPNSITIRSKELIAKQLGQVSGATGRNRPVPMLIGRTHWSVTTSGTQDSVEIREESRQKRGIQFRGWISVQHVDS